MAGRGLAKAGYLGLVGDGKGNFGLKLPLRSGGDGEGEPKVALAEKNGGVAAGSDGWQLGKTMAGPRGRAAWSTAD